MAIGEICTRETVFTTRETTVATAARLMRHHHVGKLVVVEQMNGGRRVPVGIVSIDDLLEVLAEEFSELAKIMAREQARETSSRR